jgi:hypothetical protein
MTSQRVFFKEFEEEFWSAIKDGFGIMANKCIYAYDVEKYVITDAP